MENLKTFLDAYHMNTLKEVAAYLQLEPYQVSARKEQLIDELVRAIRARAGSRDFIRALTEAERAVLALLLNANRPTHIADLNLPLMMAGLVYVDGYEATAHLPLAKQIVMNLLRRGLVVNLTDPGNMSTRRTFETVQTISLAPEVEAALPRDMLPMPEPKGLHSLAAPPARIVSGEPAEFLRQLFFIWAELRRQPGKQLKAGGLGKRDLRRIAESLKIDPDAGAERMAWMYALLQALNLIETHDEVVRAAEGDAITLFWNARLSTQLREILRVYPKVTLELAADTSVLSQYSYYAHIPLKPSAQIRQSVLDVLAKVAATSWLPFSLFLALLTGGRPGALTIDDNNRNIMYSNLRWYAAKNREQLEAALLQLDRDAILCVLRELQILGIVDLGYNEGSVLTGGQAPLALQVTGLAHAHFSNTPIADAPPTDGQVILQPDFQILALGPVALRTLANLERFAEREKFDESVVAYRLTRDSAYLAFQRGETPESMQAVLQEATGIPVPQNIARSLEEWGGQYERIVIRRHVTILQLDDPQILEQLLADAILRRYLHRMDDHTAWLNSDHTAKVEQRLWMLEMLPTYSQGPETDLPHSLRWKEEHLAPRHPMPSLYVTGTIRRIAAPCDGGWQLTPQTVRAAVATGMPIPDMIALLEKMTGAPLSPEWQKQLKAWGSHFGAAQLAQVLLLRLESAEALQELRHADRRLSRWLRPLPQGEGVAIVNEAHWDEAREILAEWGVAVTETPWW